MSGLVVEVEGCSIGIESEELKSPKSYVDSGSKFVNTFSSVKTKDSFRVLFAEIGSITNPTSKKLNQIVNYD